MDKNNKLIPLSLDGKAKVLCKLEGNVYFQKILTKTDVHLRKMTVPHWFVQEHGDKIRRSVLLKTVSSKQSWTVTLSISITEKTQVRAVGGWKEFVTFHDLTKGDLLIFSLIEISEFEVHLYREKACKCRESHSRKLDDAKLSGKNAKQPDEHLGAQRKTGSSGSIIKRKATVREECAILGSSLCNIDLKLPSKLGKFGGGDSFDARDVAVVHSRRDLKPKCDTRVGLAEQAISRMKEDSPQQAFPSLKKLSRPSFFKRLTVTSFSNIRMGPKYGILDLPTAFWKEFCKDMHSLVKLQGICEGSPMRTVTCARHRRANQNWRMRLTKGWREFAMENNLEVNQVLQFSLAGDSFFVVRRVDS